MTVQKYLLRQQLIEFRYLHVSEYLDHSVSREVGCDSIANDQQVWLDKSQRFSLDVVVYIVGLMRRDVFVISLFFRRLLTYSFTFFL